MATYLVSYDVKKPGQNYDDLISALSAVGARILKSAWVIEVNQGAKGVRAAVMSHLDYNDDVVVTEIAKDSDWATHTRADNPGVKFLQAVQP